MKLNILCLDDNLESLHQPLQVYFQRFLSKDSVIPNLQGGVSDSFTINGYGENDIIIEITSNSQNNPEKVKKEIEEVFSFNQFDLILVDDDWGQFGNTIGQTQLLPHAITSLKGTSNQLPIFVLFTQHWDQEKRVDMFCTLMEKYPEVETQITGINKNDSSGFTILIQRIISTKRSQEEIEKLKNELSIQYRPKNMIGNSPAMQEVYKNITVASSTQATVLLLGESGTGKELVAKAIHGQSKQKDNSFFPVNCGAIPESMLESELFGHEKGAFTGASKEKKGFFEKTKNGTIFLDEIAEMSLYTQKKLLRAIQEKEFIRLGGTEIIKFNARIITATNKDLLKLVEEKSFREDLYYRINVFPITIPPLRERKEDIPELVMHFIKKSALENNKDCNHISKNALSLLINYSWPGNIRQLENCITTSVLRCRSSEISTADIPDEYKKINIQAINHDWCPNHIDKKKAIDAIEFLDICENIAILNGNVTQTDLAKALNLSRPRVTQKKGNLIVEIKSLLAHPPNAKRWKNARNSIKKWKGLS